MIDRLLWVVTRTKLRRFRLDGTELDERVLASTLDPDGWLVASSAAPRLPVWAGTPNHVLRIDAADPVGHAPPLDDTFVLPVSETRWLGWTGGQLRCWRPSGELWRTRAGDPSSALIAAQVVLDGRLFAFAQQRTAASELKISVVSARDGSAHTVVRFNGASSVAFAALRGFAVVRVAERLIIVDLRFGRLVRELELPPEVEHFAIDDTLALVGLVGPNGMLVVDPEALARTPSARDDDSPIETERESPEDEKPADSKVNGTHAELTPAPVVDAAQPPIPDVPLVRLLPVEAGIRATPVEAAQALELRMEWVGARVHAAIAYAWDIGRLVHSTRDGLPFATEVAGILGLQSGFAPDLLTDAITHVHDVEGRLEVADRARNGRQLPIEILAHEFGLSQRAVQILLIACGPLLRGEYARLFGILGNDPERALVDEHLVTEVLAGGDPTEGAAIARELDADRPLRRSGIVELGNKARPFSAIIPEPFVIRTIASQPAIGEREPHFQPRAADRTLDQLQMPRQLILDAIEYLGRPSQEPLRIVVRGRVGSGRHALLAALAARAGRTLGVIDTATMPRGERLKATLQQALRRALLRGALPCVDNLDTALPSDDRDTLIQITALLREHPGPLALRLPPEATVALDPGYLLLQIPPRDERQRTASWEDALHRFSIPVSDGAELAARYRIGPGVIERVCTDVLRAPRKPTSANEWIAALDDLVRQHLEGRIGQIANRVSRLASWRDVVLPEDVLDSLLELTARVRHRKKVYEQWGFDATMTTSRGITALFAGSPGTGKTMVAGVIARDLGLEMYRVDVSRISSKWIGETEKNLGSLFDAAEDGQVMLLFDEADSLFAKRTEVKSSVDRYANMEVNYLLQRLDSFEGIAILTTNFGTAIDPAFKRRLTYRVTFPFPDEEMREQLWKTLIPPQMPIGGPIDFAGLARRFRLSGGYIRNAALRAAFLAAEEGTALLHDHVERAIRMEFRELGKLADTGTID